jgi:hypothetical protein
MDLVKFFRSNSNKAALFFCLGFLMSEPINLVLWTCTGVFLALQVWDWFDPSEDEE